MEAERRQITVLFTDLRAVIIARRTPTEGHALLARAWQAANDKARELG